MNHRITSLEQWGLRSRVDFQPAGRKAVKEAGFTGVFVNGGSGIGPDMISPECMLTTSAIPNLMPRTTAFNSRLIKQQIEELAADGLEAWLNVWGVVGCDEESEGGVAESNRLFVRKTRLELNACLETNPELFGFRDKRALSWRGNRPLCVSHPTVQRFYEELFSGIVREYPAIRGIVFFPGDSDAEFCDSSCPRCAALGQNPWERMVSYVNRIHTAVEQERPNLPFYFTVWNQEGSEGVKNVQLFMEALAPGIGITMTMSDHVEQIRRSGPVTFNQPWSLLSEPGELFLRTAREAEKQGRQVMVFGEISQSEVWDPACHNFPLPGKILSFLRAADGIPCVNALHDFWGHRGPFLSHANHAASAEYFADPMASQATLLRRSSVRHYGIPEASTELIDAAIEQWRIVEKTVDDWALIAWMQRISYAVGRVGARGLLFRALVPPSLRKIKDQWGYDVMLRNGTLSGADFSRFQQEDRLAFLAASASMRAFAEKLNAAGLSEGGLLALREAGNIELAGELIASIGRTLEASCAFEAGDWERLREVVDEEILAREREMEITGYLGYGAGVNVGLVSEDVQNMRYFLSHPAYPHVPDDAFHFTESPYSV